MRNKKITGILMLIAIAFFGALIVIGKLIGLGTARNGTGQWIYFIAGILIAAPVFIGVSMYFSAYKKGVLYPVLLVLFPFMFSGSIMIAAGADLFDLGMSWIAYTVLVVIGFGAGAIGMIKGISRYKKETA